jgi:hypothetical protein
MIVTKSEVPVLSGPDSLSGEIKRQNGLGESFSIKLSPSHDLEALCESGEWAQVKTVAIEGSSFDLFGKPITPDTGWVEKKFLTRELSDDQRRGLYWNIADDEFIPSEDKDWVRKGALRALSDNKRCKRVDGGRRITKRPSLDGVDRSGQAYAVCNNVARQDPGKLWNVFFSKADIDSNKSLATPEAYDEAESRKMCEAAIRSKANYPSTVNIHSFAGYGTRAFENGNRLIRQTFSAKTAYGLELTYVAECWIKPHGEFEINVTVKGGGASSVPQQPQQTKPGWVTAPQ